MTTECRCLRSIDEHGIKQYYCIDRECYKSEAERLNCVTTKTCTEECAFAQGDKCTVGPQKHECLQISTGLRCPLHRTKQANWRVLERERDRRDSYRPIDSVYGKPHTTGLVVEAKPTKSENGVYELILILDTEETITRSFSSESVMDDFRKRVKGRYIWLEGGKLTITAKVSTKMVVETIRMYSHLI